MVNRKFVVVREELPIVVNWCIYVCKGRIGMGRVTGFVLSEMEGHEIFQKTDEKYPSLPPPPPQPIKNDLPQAISDSKALTISTVIDMCL